MSEQRVFTLAHQEARNRAIEAVRRAPEGWMVRISEPKRSLEQNSLQWTILGEFARQQKWPIDGDIKYMSASTWKEVLTAAFRREQLQMAKGIYGGYVMVGLSTSSMGKRTFSEWIEFLHSVAAEMGVKL